MNSTRREILSRALKGTVLTLSVGVGQSVLSLTPRQARASGRPLLKLNAEQAGNIETLGEALLPGSAELGLVAFIDHQLAADPNDALLIAKYFEIPPPYADFYFKGLSAAAALAQRMFNGPLATLDSRQLHSLIERMARADEVVDGFATFLFYLCLRSDAVDVVYGTPEGFRKLDLPYMAHILPPESWHD